ncbi:MAG: hypothetical protein WC433_07340 [Candidatus Omnitrophota bacterium]
MVKFGWDKLKRFLAQANTWSGQQTFSSINVTGGTIAGATITENFTTSTDPATNAAVTTAIVNSYNGVVVTLTAAGNTQTLQSPTTTATIRKFMVINNDTSNNSLSVVANSVTFTLTAGEGQCFLWDGTAWGPTDLGITSIPVPVTQGGTGSSTAAGAFTNIKQAATTSTSGVTIYSGTTKALAGTDTASAMTPADTKAAIDARLPTENLIGVPGQMGFGVGICPPANLPPGMVGMPGYDQLGSDNYGNYIYKEGSVMIWVPRFYYRIAHADNPTYATYGVNSIDIKGIDTYPTTALANAAGYALHRAFIDGGVEKLGFFRDKYKCSKVANGTGFTAGSIKNGLPLSSAAAHNPFSGLTGGANYYYSAIDLAHRRDGVDGAVNTSSIFFCSSQFMRSAIAMLSMAHGQAATSTANCAWYLANKNYPKGCNNNALSDTDDTTVKWENDGYSNCGKTGSAGYGGGAGNVFAKSTHNGQNCGSADDNGLMYEISIGATCIATTKAIEAISRANPCEITITGHGLVSGDVMQIGTAITQADWVGLNGKVWPITKTGDNTFTVAFDSSGFGTAYDDVTDPGTCVLGTFYVAKEATSMKDFTNGVAAATDHWGATGVAAMMDRFVPPFGAGDTFAQRFGSGGNQVLSEATSGAGYLLSGLGLPKDADGMDATGTNLFGKDYCYVYVINDMCLLVASGWSDTATAGVWLAAFSATRGYSGDYAGFRAACYHV